VAQTSKALSLTVLTSAAQISRVPASCAPHTRRDSSGVSATRFIGATIREMPNFSGANLRGAKFGEDIQSGQVFVRGLIDVQEMRIEVAGIFDGADLTGASFDNAILDASWAYTRFARIGGLSFSRANLSGANLRNVWGVEVDFVNANLSNADLSGAIFQTRSANYPRCAPMSVETGDSLCRRIRLFAPTSLTGVTATLPSLAALI